MNTRFLLACLAGAGLCALPFRAAAAAELPARRDVFQMLREGKFDELEKITGDLRAQKVEFYHGYSLLSQFYGELEVSRDADDDIWRRHLQTLEQWAQAKPESATARIAAGNAYISYAWKARGGGYANTVAAGDWRLFSERLDKAQEYLEAAERLNTRDPEVYHALLVLQRGQGRPKTEMEATFRKGVALERNYLQLYETYAYTLAPRWYGDPGEWEMFASREADARGGDDGDILYLVIARSLAWTEGEDFFQNTRASYARMQRGFEASLRRSPDHPWEMNSYCYFACIAGDRDTAKKYFQKINEQWEKSIWRDETYFQQWQAWALRGGTRPANKSRYVSTVAVQRRVTTGLLIAGAVWIVLTVIIGVVVWRVVRYHQKS